MSKSKRSDWIIREALDWIDWRLGTQLAARYHNYRGGFHTSKYVFREDRVAFVHIPKTGGTTVRSILDNYSSARFVNLFKHRPISRQCDPGHFAYITFLRDPVARVWSYYQHSLRDRSNPYHRFATYGIDHFLKNCWEVRNMACRYLSGDVKRESYKQEERARSNMEEFLFVGKFEEFEVSVFRLLSALGYDPNATEVPLLNKGKYPRPSSGEVEAIDRKNQHDINLYRYFIDNIWKANAI